MGILLESGDSSSKNNIEEPNNKGAKAELCSDEKYKDNLNKACIYVPSVSNALIQIATNICDEFKGKKILITGSNGQLGRSFLYWASKFKDFQFSFTDITKVFLSFLILYLIFQSMNLNLDLIVFVLRRFPLKLEFDLILLVEQHRKQFLKQQDLTKQ